MSMDDGEFLLLILEKVTQLPDSALVRMALDPVGVWEAVGFSDPSPAVQEAIAAVGQLVLHGRRRRQQ